MAELLGFGLTVQMRVVAAEEPVAAQKDRLVLFCVIVLLRGLSNNPAAKTSAERYSDFRAPLIERLSFDHVTELGWRDA